MGNQLGMDRYRYRKITVIPVCRANGTGRGHESQENDF